jgi:transcriptional regulator with XRE-family HTH domain
MVHIGLRLRKIRKSKGMSMTDVEKTSGLMRCYQSRVENCITVPTLETLDRYSLGLQMPLHDLLYQLTYRAPKLPVDRQEGPEVIQPVNSDQEPLPC